MRTKTTDGSAIMTIGGTWITPLDPDPYDIEIHDIAHALSNQCRFSGHTRYFYSVAQHSCHVSDLCPKEHKLAGLLHDGTEAYLSDLARPIKQQPGFGESYRLVEDGLMDAIAVRFGLAKPSDEFYKLPKEVKYADMVMLRAEMKALMPAEIFDEYWEEEMSSFDIGDIPIKTWTPSKSKTEFLKRYRILTDGEALR